MALAFGTRQLSRSTNTSSARQHGAVVSRAPCIVRAPAPKRACMRPVASSSSLRAAGWARRSITNNRSILMTARSLLPSASPALPEPLPEGVRLEPAAEGETRVTYDAGSNVVRIPLRDVEGASKRTKLVMFTCNKCGGRSARLVNPVAWEKGLVFAQCQHCDVWHTLAANNPRIYEEVRYDRSGDGKNGDGDGAAGSDSGASAGTVLGTADSSEGGSDDGAESR